MRGRPLTTFTADASAAVGGPPWLARRRAAAYEQFQATSLPTEAEEIWRYSGIDSFDLDRFAPSSTVACRPEADLAAAAAAAEALGPRSGLVVTRSGRVSAVDLDSAAARGVVLSGAADGVGEPELGLLGPAPDAFALLHGAFLADAVVVVVPAGVVVPAPLVVVHLVDTDAAPAPLLPLHTVIEVGPRAEVTVVELLVPVGGGDGAALVLPVAEAHVGQAAVLHHCTVQLLSSGCTQVGLQSSRIERDATYKAFTAGMGGRYARVRTDSELVGQGGRSELLALYLGTDQQIHDFRTTQDHAAPRTESELVFTGAVADRARSVYSGLIRIRHGARASNAMQTNRNLLLSDEAHADSVPNLDILENDVRCSHASTVGPIDEEQRYYLESRGIDPRAAERLIVAGFFSDLARRAPLQAVAALIEGHVGRRLAPHLEAVGGAGG